MTHGERRAQTHNWPEIEQHMKEGHKLEIAFTASSYSASLVVKNSIRIANGTGKCLEWALDELEWQLDEEVVP